MELQAQNWDRAVGRTRTAEAQVSGESARALAVTVEGGRYRYSCFNMLTVQIGIPNLAVQFWLTTWAQYGAHSVQTLLLTALRRLTSRS